jgi:hypothetical protein
MFGIRIDRVGAFTHPDYWKMATADHHQVLGQIRMEALTQFQENILVMGFSIPLSQFIDLSPRPGRHLRVPTGGIMIRRQCNGSHCRPFLVPPRG